ncbi:MAG: ammonium transporter [Firmicutes bacterium]|nr:ammonium transporter [Bacillota bacterium]
MNTGDTAWVLISSALVMLMTPAVGLFYGGMVRRKNLLSTIMFSLTILAVISLQWVLFGYSLAFGPDHFGLIGDLSWLGLRGIGDTPNPIYASNIPHVAFLIFQMMFAVITPALITGAFVERIKFSSFLLFTILWATIVYDPIAHWVWGAGGWLHSLGVLDFAGGTVVHIASGISALAVALVIRRRQGFGEIRMEPGNIPLTILGAVFLWMGWFGFNAGSALGANALAAHAFLVTNTAAAAASLAWLTIRWALHRPSVLGAAIGGIVGLVAITPAAGYVTPFAAILIGAIAAVISHTLTIPRQRLGIDESLDVWACHGMAGTWGAIATGLFASKAINGAGANGLFYGNWSLAGVQLLAVLVVWAYSFGVTWALAKVIDRFHGLAVSEVEEYVGLDIAQHGEATHM